MRKLIFCTGLATLLWGWSLAGLAYGPYPPAEGPVRGGISLNKTQDADAYYLDIHMRQYSPADIEVVRPVATCIFTAAARITGMRPTPTVAIVTRPA